MKSIEDIAGVIPDGTVKGLISAMQPKSTGLVYEAVAKCVEDMVADGWSGTQMVTQVYSRTPQTLEYTNTDMFAAVPRHYLQRIDFRQEKEQNHPSFL